jgi:uncharacterized protein DUF5655
MTRWTCPECEREFARAHQGHVCVPGGTVDDSFAGRPAVQRAIYDALVAHVRTLGEVHEDSVGVGVFLKHEHKFAEVRPTSRALSVWLVLPRRVEHARFSRYANGSGGRVWHVLRLTTVGEVDDEVRSWLTAAYNTALRYSA